MKNLILLIMWSYNDVVKDYDYSFEKVKVLLVEVGFLNGFDIEIWVMLVSCFYNLNVCCMVEFI